MAQEYDDAKMGELPEDIGTAERDEAGADGSLVDESVETADDDGEPEGEDDEDAGIETSDFEVNDPTMLLGEMRDDVLAGIKGPIGWAKLKEAQQVFVANAVEQACRRVIRGAVRLAATMDLDAVEITISGTTHKTDKDQIEAKLLCPFDPETWAAMPTHGKRVLVFADHEKLMGARAAAVMKDQPGLFGDGTETPEEKAKREAIEAEQREHEASIARAHQFKPLDDTPTVGSEAAKLVGEMLPPKIKDAVDRGVAHRQSGGACVVPKDLEGKPAEVGAWLKGWDSADASADGHAVDGATGEVVPAEPAAKPPRGHRGKRTTVEQRVAKRVAETAGA